MAIKTFKDKATAAAYLGLPVRSLPPTIRQRAKMKLEQVHNAQVLNDLKAPPGNMLEAQEPVGLGPIYCGFAPAAEKCGRPRCI